MKVFFTADQHYGHKRIIELCSRPFKDVDEMDAELIRRHNERVQDGDMVIHVGDFAYRGKPAEHYLRQLNGDHYLIIGNHDDAKALRGIVNGFKAIEPYREIRIEGELFPIVLQHYAARVWNQSHRGALHFFGHTHGTLPGNSQSCDVGVDCWDYRPVTLNEIKTRLAMLPKYELTMEYYENLDKQKGNTNVDK